MHYLFDESPCVLELQVPEYLKVMYMHYNYYVPAFYSNGSLVLPEKMIDSVDEMLLELDEFFENMADEDDEENREIEEPEKENIQKSNTQSTPKIKEVPERFPIQDAIRIIEYIARKNETKNDDSIDDWIYALKRKMSRLSKENVQKFYEMKINFLSVLKEDGFAPPLKNKRKWNEFVKYIAEVWGLNGFSPLRK